jgi:hypothetical protein
MIFKSFGCSLIFGTDLPDQAIGFRREGSKFSWPAKLAQQKAAEYKCYARPGAGNLQILEQILNQTKINDSATFIIGWSFINRFDYHRPKDLTLSPWYTLMPIAQSDIARVYYRDLHSEYCDKLSSLAYIKLAIDTLTQKKISFVMTYMDELLFDRESNISVAVTELQDYVKPYMTKFDGQTFLQWSKKQGFPISKTLHPLEEAHTAAAELIESYNLV